MNTDIENEIPKYKKRTQSNNSKSKSNGRLAAICLDTGEEYYTEANVR